MKHTEQIVRTLRANPKADISAMASDDASDILAKIITTKHIPVLRALLIDFVRQVHTASAAVLHREHKLRTQACLDAADARARLDAANRRLRRARTLYDALHGAGQGNPVTAEQTEQMRAELLTQLDPVPLPEQP